MESDEVGRRDLLKFAGAAAATGLTGCLGGNNDENQGSETTTVSNDQGSDGGEYSELADEYGLTESAQQVLEEHCNLPSDTREKMNEWTNVINGEPIEQASFRKEGDRYIMRMTHYDGPVTDERDLLLNGDEITTTENVLPDTYAREWVQAYSEDSEQMPDIVEAINNDLEC